MELNELKELLTQFDQSTLTEFDLKDGSYELYFNKNNTPRPQVAPVASQNMETHAPQTQVGSQSNPTTNEPSGDKQSQSIVSVAEGKEIVSPLVGVCYLQPSPDKANFKEVGDTVKKGEVVCIVEAMKLMNEITSDVAGVVTEVLVENEQVVEFGQPLLRVKEGTA
ncbi:MAG TPA: acetyl-CoA carboxylase biotin carboxyl carrier protein [Candidatus Tetragenococcus pullicola]|nr:acetyl-CoA carboxylase biotin carboxyl carrier protein [Candidatus Tetragenococcus pullicola]